MRSKLKFPAAAAGKEKDVLKDFTTERQFHD